MSCAGGQGREGVGIQEWSDMERVVSELSLVRWKVATGI
jgi:hypothetical protein